MLMEDKSRAGACLLITNQRGFEYWPDREVSYVMPKEKSILCHLLVQRTPDPHLETTSCSQCVL